MSCGGDGSLEVLWARAQRLAAEDRYAEAAAEWDRVIERHGDDDRVVCAQALSGKCWCLYRMRDRDRFPAAVDELCGRYENAEDPQLRIASGYGLQLKAWWLLHDGRGIEAIAISEPLAARFLAETDTTARIRLGEMSYSVATGLSWGARSRCERMLTVTLIAEPALAYAASKSGALRIHRPSAASGGGEVMRAVRRCIATREVLRARLERSLVIYDLVLDEPTPGGDSTLATLQIRAGLNRAVALMTLGRVRTGQAAFRPLFELNAIELAQAMRAAPPQPYGGFEATDVSIAMLAKASPGDAQARAAAKELLRHQSKHANSRVQRLAARLLVIVGRRD